MYATVVLETTLGRIAIVLDRLHSVLEGVRWSSMEDIQQRGPYPPVDWDLQLVQGSNVVWAYFNLLIFYGGANSNTKWI